jgi:regulator of protease activity HflC (stomatin/prohibitin superfamily)
MLLKNIKESLFTVKKKVVAFGGSDDDLVWVYVAGSDDKNMQLLAETPNEVVHIKNGAVAGKYFNQKIDHKYTKNDIDKYFFINIKKPCQTAWGTRERLEYKDTGTGRIVSIGANGVISFHIADSLVFIEKVLGNRNIFSTKNLTEEMLPKIFEAFNDHLLSVIQGENLEYSQLDSKLKEISAHLLLKIDAGLQKYGIHVEEFIVKQFVKPEELKARSNELVKEAEEFDDRMLSEDRKIAIMKKREEAEKQQMQMEQSRAEHETDLARKEAQLQADIEKLDYETKGVSYKELREMDREDIRTLAEAEAKVEDAKKIPQDTVVVIKSENRGKCPYCDGDVSVNDVFCPTCKKKMI